MKKLINLLALAALLLLPGLAKAQCPDGELQCSVTIIGIDSYGDGWNGAKISVYQGITLRGEVTVPSDGGSGYGYIPHTFEVPVCSGDSIRFVWTAGSFDSEASYTILNGNDDTIHSGSGAMATQMAWPECPTCIKVIDLAASNLTNEGATISWTGNESGSQWLVYLNGELTSNSPVSNTSYTFTGLEANTEYTYSVRTYCGNGDTSSASSGTFRTLCQNGNCEITLNVSQYSYCGTVAVMQNGGVLDNVTFSYSTGTSKTVEICNGDSLFMVYTQPSYSYSTTTWTVIDAGDSPIATFNNTASTGDTVVALANGCPSCIPPANLQVSNITSTGATFTWEARNDETEWAVYIDDTERTEVANDGTVDITGLEANTAYTFRVRAVCISDEDTSNYRSISFRTACEGDQCDLTLQVSGSYSSYYGSVDVMQRGSVLKNVSSNQTVQICSGDSLVLRYKAPSSTWYSANWTILDAGETELVSFTNGAANDSIVYVAENGCPSCIPPSNLHISEADTNYFTMSWNPISNAEGYIVYLDSVEVTSYNGYDTFYMFTVESDGIVPMQNHEVWVRAICDEGDTSSYRRGFGMTSCSMIHIDEETEYDFTFEGYTSNQQGDFPCWYFSHSCVGPNNADGNGGDAGIWWKSPQDAGCSSVAGAYFCMPVLDAAINTLELSFTGKVGAGADHPDKVVIGVADFSGENVVWLDTVDGLGRGGGPLPGDFFQYNPLTFEDYDGEGVRFAFKLVNYSNWNIIRAFHVRVIPQCLAPSNLTGANYINPDSTYFTWTPNGSADEWQVAVTAADATEEDVNAMTLTTVTDTNYVIPEGTLTLGEEYTFWVRSNCTGLQSEWVSHTFISGTIIMPASGTDTVYACTATIFDNGYQAGWISGSTSTIVLRPQQAGQMVAIAGGWYRGEGSSTGGISTSSMYIYDGEGTDGPVLWEAHNSEGNYKAISDTIIGEDQSGVITIRLNAGTWVGQGCEVNTFCTDAPTCFRPKHLAVSGVETTSATLTWDNANATDYIIYYRADSTETWESVTGTNITDSTFTFADGTLDPATKYWVKVAGDCGNGDVSLVSTEVSFRTPCLATVIDDNNSIVESFEGDFPPACFTLAGNTGLMIQSTTQAYDSTHSLRFQYSSLNDNAYFISPLLDADDLMNVKFMYRAYSTAYSETFAVGYSTTDAQTESFTWGNTVTASNTNNWKTFFDTVPADAKYIAIHYWGDNYYLFVDSLVIEKNDGTMPCLAPSISVSGTTDSTITVNIEAASDSVYVGIMQGQSWDAASVVDTLIPAGNFTFTGLTANSYYTIGARILCGESNYSDWEVTTQYISGGYIPGPTDCNAPTNVTTTATENSVTVSFNAVSGYIDGYEVEIVAGSWSGSMNNAVFINGTTYTFNNLNAGTQYTVAVRTVCDSEYYEYSNWTTVSVTTQTAVTDCDTPTDIDVVAGTTHSTSATIRWTENGNATKWALKITSTGFDSTYTATSNPYTVNGLTPSTTYYMQVRAICSDSLQSSWSDLAVFQTAQGDGIDGVDMLGVELFPNPASSIVTIQVAEKAEVTLVDLNGRVSGVWSVNNGKLTIDVSTIAQGTYFVRVVGESGIAVRKLVIK